MNRSEAIDALKLGKTLKHRYFAPGESVRREGPWYILGDGSRCMPPHFWRARQSESFDDGWFVDDDVGGDLEQAG
ncbi:hypothetical protein F7U66_01630 [Vibrio parahaemolyticus]|nr:hypothetical protein [Vibrio parahaemolyticus]